MRSLLSATAVLFLLATPANAKILAVCGPFEGYGYYDEGAFVPKGETGWTEDKIGIGSTSITEVDGKFDIIFSDVASKNVSSRADGVKVNLISINNDAEIITILVSYPNVSIEIYTYNVIMKKFVLLQTKFNSIINKSTMMVADCK